MIVCNQPKNWRFRFSNISGYNHQERTAIGGINFCSSQFSFIFKMYYLFLLIFILGVRIES
ncbi:hypothetical protein R70331_07580 [Paenibacillus sp. FSL R7-0331]|nr:hypothetical protein R70331_07580 [Paenibacillus sp. FSL R7-0331]